MPVYEIAMLVDARGLGCPSPTVLTTQALRSMTSGEIVEVLATDADSIVDFRAWAQATGNELLNTCSDGGTYRFLIRRT